MNHTIFTNILLKAGFQKREENIYRKHLQEIEIKEKTIIWSVYDSGNDILLSVEIPKKFIKILT